MKCSCKPARTSYSLDHGGPSSINSKDSVKLPPVWGCQCAKALAGAPWLYQNALEIQITFPNTVTVSVGFSLHP